MTTQTAAMSMSQSEGVGTRVGFDSVHEPGTYICELTGHLFRIPEEEVSPGRSPLMSIIGSEPIRMRRISDNPYVTLSKARVLASNLDLNVNF